MYRTKEQLAEDILADINILEQFEKAKVKTDYENVVKSVIQKYEMLKILR